MNCEQRPFNMNEFLLTTSGQIDLFRKEIWTLAHNQKRDMKSLIKPGTDLAEMLRIQSAMLDYCLDELSDLADRVGNL